MTLTIQFYTMLSMAAMGIYIGAAIDTYGRFTRNRNKPSFNWLTACNDVLFWLVQALIVFYVLLQSNYGEVRFYIFLALVCGFAAYQSLFRTFYQTLLERIITKSIQLYRITIRLFTILLINPIKYLLKVLYSLCIMVLTTCLAVLLFLFKLIWKPVRWVLLLLYKWTGLHKQVKKLQPILHKIKEFFQSMRKKKE
ncbi:spore cortex biosynthesis protein YabQ [Alkalihalobacillus sp. MEB130]|uniref:spore cortex biosynthesis protein YabQ n=1 Tax=Alkalihalobacillus sp. MEB130 TaxID=2976704 RepID=UPI0028DDD926|nr:spore cortex biosynthesis protein YabQ [Alkalihalobacillus sp. MEB130]MDT8862655.1 spore cortex biosynthesis protein YabQ [Alkalihalobacillus sp. MEB130]